MPKAQPAKCLVESMDENWCFRERWLFPENWIEAISEETPWPPDRPPGTKVLGSDILTANTCRGSVLMNAIRFIR